MKLKRFGLGLSTMALVAGTVPFSAMAAAPTCEVSNGIAYINDATCSIAEDVSGVQYSGTIGKLGDVLYAFAKDGSFGYSHVSGNIEATVTDVFSTEQITWLASLTGEIDEKVVLKLEADDFVYAALPFTMPEGYSLDLTGKVAHLPAGTSIVDAFATYKAINNKETVVAINGEAYNNISFDAKPSRNVGVIHLDPETTIANALATLAEVKMANPGETFAVASGMNYWIKSDASLEKPEIYVLDADSLDDAFAAEGVDKVYAHMNLKVAELSVPKDKTFEVLDGVFVNLPAGSKVSGNVTGEGKVLVGGIEYNKIATSLELGMGEEEVKINTNSGNQWGIDFEPTDAEVVLTLENSNPEAVSATIEKDEDGHYFLTFEGLADGEAILTVTEENSGLSASLKVTVEQEFAWGYESTDSAIAFIDLETPIKGDVSFSFDEVKLTDELKEQSEYLKAVYDISLIDNDTDTKVVVKDNKINIYLTLDKENYEGMKHFKVAYINADGEIAELFDPEVEGLDDAEADLFTLGFETSHLSLYGVLASENEFPETLTPDTGRFTGSSSMTGDYRGLVATVVAMTVMMVVMEVAMWKKRQNEKQ